eukprot:GHVS01075018.1.p1 GENE.GHVS01075018.1~~GHVS01075018.1.p1  ORF type:complete len:710 (-),score=73.79 GHVS01075018.1:365-2494(-)
MKTGRSHGEAEQNQQYEDTEDRRVESEEWCHEGGIVNDTTLPLVLQLSHPTSTIQSKFSSSDSQSPGTVAVDCSPPPLASSTRRPLRCNRSMSCESPGTGVKWRTHRTASLELPPSPSPLPPLPRPHPYNRFCMVGSSSSSSTSLSCEPAIPVSANTAFVSSSRPTTAGSVSTDVATVGSRKASRSSSEVHQHDDLGLTPRRQARRVEWIGASSSAGGKSLTALGRRERLLQRSMTVRSFGHSGSRNMGDLRKSLEGIFEPDPMHSLEKAASIQAAHCPRLRRFASSWKLEMAVWVIIIFFCVIVWVETSLGNSNYWGVDFLADVSVWVNLQYAIMGLFVVELLVKILILRFRFLNDIYNCIDLGVFFFSIVPFTICISLSRYGPKSTSTAAWRKMLILRIIRVMRVAELLRYYSAFRELWVLIRGVTRSLKVLVWGMVLMTLMIYIFAIFATTMIGFSVDFEGHSAVQEQWGTVVNSMIGLFQIMTLDDWMSLIQPILEKQKALIIFFILFIMMSVFALTNLMTAVIVESALNLTRDDALESDYENRLRCKQMQKGLEEFTGKEELTVEEYKDLAEEPLFRRLMRAYDCDRSDVEILCDLLSDGLCGDDAPVRIEHFIVGMQKLKGWAKSKDLLEALSRLTYVEETQQHVVKVLDHLAQSVKTSHSIIINQLSSTPFAEDCSELSQQEPLCGDHTRSSQDADCDDGNR